MTKDSGEFSNVASRFKEKGGGGGSGIVIFYTPLQLHIFIFKGIMAVL